MNLTPIRHIPEKITVENFPVEKGYYSGVKYSGKKMAISSQLDSRLVSFTLRREAFRQYIPYKWDQVPQYSDLAWAYAYFHEGHRDDVEKWWEESSMPVFIPLLQPYYGVKIMKSFIASKGLDAVLSCVKLLRRFAEVLPFLDFKIYYEVILNFQSYLTPSLSKAETRILSLISRHHSIEVKDIVKMSRHAKSTVYRCIGRLRAMNLITGFINVNFRKIGLITLLLIIEENSNRYMEVFAEFPFTYRIFQLSSANPTFISILLPYDYNKKLQEIIEKYDSLKLSTVVRQSYSIFIEDISPEQVLLKMCERYYTHLPIKPRPKLEGHYYKPTMNELKLINMIHCSGESSPSKLCKKLGLSYWTTRSMIKKLRKENVLYNVVYPTGVALGDPSIILLREREELFRTVSNTFSSVSTVLLTYVRGQFDGIWGIIYTKPYLTRAVVNASRLLLKDKIILFQPVISAESSGWQVPLNLYNPREKMFDIDRTLEELNTSLERVSSS